MNPKNTQKKIKISIEPIGRRILLEKPANGLDVIRSAGIGIKSDHTLVIGRERVRILAGVSKYDGGERLVTGNQPARPIIEIGSTSSEKHHRAVLGENLVKYLKEVNETISKLNERVASLEIDLLRYKFTMARHQHLGVGVGAIVTLPDPISAIPAFLSAVPETLNNITTTIGLKILISTLTRMINNVWGP